MRRPPFYVAILLAGLFLGAGLAQANHSWSGYHWSRPSNPFTIQLGDNVTSAWDPYLQAACDQWSVTSGSCNNPSNPIRCVIIPGSASPRQCRPADGEVEVCNARYGNNGWLGIAGIWVSGTHITRGYVKVNDYYFDTPTYNTPEWRQMVMSQEVGHIFGLAHQDENFNNADLLDACGRGSCMDYSANPANQTTPNQHDYDQLVSIYNHSDGPANLAAGFPADEGVDLEDPSAWGQAVRFDEKGRGIVYERVLPNGDRLVNFILWAD